MTLLLACGLKASKSIVICIEYFNKLWLSESTKHLALQKCVRAQSSGMSGLMKQYSLFPLKDILIFNPSLPDLGL